MITIGASTLFDKKISLTQVLEIAGVVPIEMINGIMRKIS